MTALSDLRIVDLSTHIAGPFCTKLFADFGADVIKVEPPGVGDEARRLGPFPGEAVEPEASGLFLHLNTNKRGVTLNLETAKGRDLLRELVAIADVVVESFAPGTMERLGLGFQSLEQIRPGIILTSITPFGQTGPWRDYQAADIVEYAASGLSAQNGSPECEPLKGPGYQTYYHGGACAFLGTMTAICYRDVEGVGQHVDVSVLEAASSVLSPNLVMALYSGRSMGRRQSGVPAGLIPCKDGHVAINIRSDRTWRDMWVFFGEPEKADDPRFATPAARRIHQEELKAALQPHLARYTMEELFHGLGALRVLVGMAPDLERLVNDPHLRQRDFFVEAQHPVAGRLVYPGAPFKMSETPWSLRGAAPLLGQHNQEVYEGLLGHSHQDLASWQAEAII